jgi:Contractile injection system tube protein
MSEQKLEKAELIELESDGAQGFRTKSGGKSIKVQFNPDSLKVTFANQLAQSEGGNSQSGTAGRQFVGAGTTKLVLTLWFDVTAMTENPQNDVRTLTKDVIFFITPKLGTEGEENGHHLPPIVRFSWGSFVFDGMIEGLEESLEYFSADGHPLRASISLTLSQQKISIPQPKAAGAGAQRAGQKPFKAAPQGKSIQWMAEKAGKGSNWQGIAAANNIEDPLRLPTGKLIDLNAKVSMPRFGLGR